MNFETNEFQGVSVSSVGSMEDFLGQFEAPEDKYKVTPREIDTDNVVEVLNSGENNVVEVIPKGGENQEPVEEVPVSNKPNEGLNKEVKPDTNVEPSQEVTETQESTIYKSVIKDLIKDGLWEDFDGIEDENGEITPLDKVNVDKELFYSIIAQKTEEIKNKATENKISVDGVSDFMKRMIELDKKGGDVRSAIETYNEFKNPLEKLDLDKVEDQRSIIYLRYSTENKLDKQTIFDIIESREKNGKLRETAEQAKEQMMKAVDMRLKAIEEQAAQRLEQEKENIKRYRSQLSESLVNNFQLKDSSRNRLLDLATKKDKNGAYGIDLMFDEAMSNPDKAAKIIMLLTDEEEYNKQVSEKRVREDKINTMKSIRLVPKNKSSNMSISGKSDRVISDDKTFDPAALFGG